MDTGDKQGRGAQADALRTEPGQSKDPQMDDPGAGTHDWKTGQINGVALGATRRQDIWAELFQRVTRRQGRWVEITRRAEPLCRITWRPVT